MCTELAPWEPCSLSNVISEEGLQTQNARLGVDMYTSWLHHVLTNLSLSMYHKQPRRIDWYGLDTKKKIIFANVSYKSTVLNLEKAGFGVNGFQPHKFVMGGSNSVHQCLQEGIVDCVPVLPTPLVGGCGSQRASSSKIGKLLG